MKKVLIPTKLNSVSKETLENHDIPVVQDEESDIQELASSHPDTEAIIVRSDKVTSDVIDAFPALKLIVRAGAGFNNIDINYARKQNIDVMNTPGANSNAVAEEVLAMMLAYCRHIVRGDNSVREGKWEKKELMGKELTGKTLGIVGLGNIGQLVLQRASGFEVDVLAYDPVISEERANNLGAKLVSLEELFQKSDFITLHVPENEETTGMVNKDLLSNCKEGAVLVNCARAGIVNEEDLREVKKGKELGFCNDVYEKDEAGEKSCADIADLMLPHLGASTNEANYNAAKRAADQLIAYMERNVTKYVVNKGVPDELDAVYQELAFNIAFLARHYLGADKAVRKIQTTYYGDLQKFEKWFTAPIVAGVASEFDAFDEPDAPKNAEEYLEEKGIEFEVREPDPNKSYDTSLTIDLSEGGKQVNQVSVRGTVAENKPIVSRINDFDGLYFEPKNHSLLVIHDDQPGALAQITSKVASYDINIEDLRLPGTKSNGTAIAIVKTDKQVPKELVNDIKKDLNPAVAFRMSLT